MSRPSNADRIATRLATAVDRHRAGALDEAETLYRRVLDDDPRQVDVLHLLGMLRLQRGQRDIGMSSVRRALRLRPLFPEAWLTLGNGLRDAGDQGKAASAFQCAIAAQPSMVEAIGNLAQGQTTEASVGRKWLDRAAAIAPTNIGVLVNLGIAAVAVGEWSRAGEAFRRAIALQPAFATSLALIGGIQRRRGLPDTAAWFARATILAPEDRVNATNLGAVWLELGDLTRAERTLTAVIHRWPHHAEALVALGIAARRRGALDDALRQLRQSVALAPSNPTGLRDLGTVVLDLGIPSAAIALTRRSLAIDPNDLQAGRNLMSASLYDPDIGHAMRWGLHRSITARFPRRLIPTWQNARTTDRPIRVAYVSSDLKEHPIGRCMVPVIVEHDRRSIEVYGYALAAGEDRLTALFRKYATVWRNVASIEDNEIVSIMASDRIDIAVFLGLHFDSNRPTLAALRCAPVQISHHDVSSMAIEEIDYLISDRVMSPVDDPEHLQERVFALPHFYVHAPLETTIEPTARREGAPVVFGAYNLPSKMNSTVLALWARVLLAVPGSRLRLRYRNLFESRVARERIDVAMRQHGIDSSRLDYLPGAMSDEEYFASLSEVDVMLDPFPFNGHTATFESLWMGVPVVTLRGEAQAGRYAAAQLRSVALSELAVTTADEYVGTAAALAVDTKRLSLMRQWLRASVPNSPLCDSSRRPRYLERFYRTVWRRWCAGVPPKRITKPAEA